MTAPLASYWRKVEFHCGSQPKPRHGHRAVTFKNDMVIFGGGNEGIIEEFNVFKHAEQRWFSMPVKGDIPPGCAAFGFTNDETRAWIFGGMLEYGKYSNELYELKLSNWECRRLKPRAPKSPNVTSPKARLGHSFNLIGNKIYLFGGLANDSPNPKQNLPKYLNDLYTLEIKANGIYQWDLPVTAGVPPCPRESHSAVAYFPKDGGSPKLIIYGGMCGLRLQDLWILEIDTLSWSKPLVNGILPAPRSLHSANVIGEKMYIFGGWVPMLLNPERPDAVQDKEWRCTNTVAVFDIPSNTWEYVSGEISDESAPKARAGHCAVSIGTRVMIFSGRDGYRKAWNNQVCCKDLWILETSKPAKPGRIVLTKSGTSVLEISWGEVTEADKFLVQIQKVDPKEYEASVKELSEETTMSGIGVLAAAAAAQQPQKVLATPLKGITTGTQSIRYITPGGGTNVKIPSGIRVISPGGAGTKLVLKSPGGNVQQGTFTLVKTATGVAFANTSGTSTQLLRVVSASQGALTNKSTTALSTASSSTTMITPVTTGGTAKGGAISSPNVRMIVVPQNSPRLPGVQLTPGQKSVRFPATLVNGGAGGTQRILLTPGNQQIRLVTSSAAVASGTGSSQRFVILNTGQTPTTSTQAAVTSSSSSTGGLSTATTATDSTATSAKDSLITTITESTTVEAEDTPEVIPQTDGPEDDFSESLSTTNQLSSSQQDSAIESAVASISSLNAPSSPSQSSDSVSNSGDLLLTKPSTSVNSDQTNAESSETTAAATSSSSSTSVDSINVNGSNGQSEEKKKANQVKYGTWYNVGTFNRNCCAISKYLVPGDEQCLAAFNPDGEITSTTILNYDNFDQVNLEPGAAYKIRVCGINIRGRGEWSDLCTLKTAQLGYPPPPSSIKITKVNGGVNISWTIPQTFSQNDVTDYSVYLGVNNESAANANAQAFQLVYQSAATTCFVSNEILAKAWTNPNPKPAILFRITARNAKGYGPATQIRWLQDSGKRPLTPKNDTSPIKKNKS